MKINARIALVSLSIVALGTLGGCSAGEEPAPLQLPPSNSSRTPSGSESGGSAQTPASGEQTQGGTPAGGETAKPAAGDPAGGKTPSDPSGKQPATPDAQCVASCNSGLKAKCQGDDTFCDDMCVYYTATELSCLSSAPTCEKSEWIRCAPEPEDNGGGSK